MPKGQKGRTVVEKACEVCGKSFSGQAGGNISKTKTCSQKCGQELRWKGKSIVKTCQKCNTEFRARENAQIYCSRQCSFSRSKLTRNCVHCGKEYSSPPSQEHVKTCSVECGYAVRNSKYVSSKVEKSCLQCGKSFLVFPSHIQRVLYCSQDCWKASPEYLEYLKTRPSGELSPHWNGKWRKSISSTGKEYKRPIDDGVESECAARRRFAKESATPAWANQDKILAFYREAKRLTKLTGVPYHVDHIVPLTSSKVCGLHCESNLEVLPATVNLKKHNRHWPDMP